MWQKLLQLQFTPDPGGALAWMLQRGVGATLAAYGADAEAGMRAARAGTVALTRWTSEVRQAMRRHPGHGELLGQMHSAAQTGEGGALFVNAGLDPKRAPSEQGDLFWWHGIGFAELDRPYAGFRRVVRGFDPRRRGIEDQPHKLTLDAGAGFDGPLVAACLTPTGEVVERLEA
jgi:serine/threonine protein phosphatase 1